MNEVIRQLYDRKSVRVYTDEPIDESVVQEILQAAAMAPTAGNQQFYTNILENTLVEYPNHAFFHETLDPKIKEIIISNCMNSVPNDQLDLTLEVYLAGITATMCTHVISGRSSRRELMNAFITAIPDKLKPHINAEPSQQYLS